MRKLVGVLFSLALFLAFGGTVQAQDKPGPKVLIGGTGNPEKFTDVVNDLTDFLREKGVAIRQVNNLSQSRDASLEELAKVGGQSFIYVTLNKGTKDKIVAQCFGSDGRKLWEEESSSLVSTISRLTNGMKKNLEKHLGQEGLLVASANASNKQ